jgi:hypothetical protein
MQGDDAKAAEIRATIRDARAWQAGGTGDDDDDLDLTNPTPHMVETARRKFG